MEVKEGRAGSPRCHDGHKDNDGDCPEETLETDSVEGGDRIVCHDLFFDDKLGCSAIKGGMRVRASIERRRGLLTRAERTGQKRYLF